MLTLTERIVFFVACMISVSLAGSAARRLVRILGRGYGQPDWRNAARQLVPTLFKTITFSTVFRSRPVTSLFHGLVAWGFLYYLLVNVGDVYTGYVSNKVFLGVGAIGGYYRFGADLLSVSVIVGMVALIVRRFILRPRGLSIRETVLLHPKARISIQRDSAIVGGFILLHVGARFLGESFHLAMVGLDSWQPLGSTVARLWSEVSIEALMVARHASWWVALGLILAFIPYFPQSKHIHIFFAPINFLLHPERRSMGEFDPLDFEDHSIEQYGAERIEHLSWKGLMDAYACIMCNRCQEACPAYETGKVLSPAALEINKRYFLNQEGKRLAAGKTSSQTLVEFAIPAEAVWACTACGACIDVCPVGNEPMRDIIEIRRHLVLMENDFPDQLQAAYRGMERSANPWNVPQERRIQWAEGLDVLPLVQNPDAELLWWVGCAPATDPQAQKSARAFAALLIAAGVDFAVLGPEERCTGDSARRSGNEYLFNELASSNVETMNQNSVKRIVTTCPHCLHSLRNEYHAFGGEYAVIHHTELIKELLDQGKLKLLGEEMPANVAFHDPCYLGRHNGIFNAPRSCMQSTGIELMELPRSRSNSFCCGAGGAQMWKEEEHGVKRVSAERIEEARTTGTEILAVGCPFCLIMLNDAAATENDPIQVRDVAEIIAQQLNEGV